MSWGSKHNRRVYRRRKNAHIRTGKWSGRHSYNRVNGRHYKPKPIKKKV